MLSWNHEDNRLYFIRAENDEKETPPREKTVANRLYSCAPDGINAQSLGRLLTHDDPVWRLSPDGVRLMIFGSAGDGGILGLSSGEFVPLSMH
jgi:hypothetical protein